MKLKRIKTLNKSTKTSRMKELDILVQNLYALKLYFFNNKNIDSGVNRTMQKLANPSITYSTASSDEY